MTPEMERIGKILAEAEGGHWHDSAKVLGGIFICSQCDGLKSRIDNPDFSQWANFGRVLKIGEKNKHITHTISIVNLLMKCVFFLTWDKKDIDQIPALVATEIARVIEEGKKC